MYGGGEIVFSGKIFITFLSDLVVVVVTKERIFILFIAKINCILKSNKGQKWGFANV